MARTNGEGREKNEITPPYIKYPCNAEYAGEGNHCLFVRPTVEHKNAPTSVLRGSADSVKLLQIFSEGPFGEKINEIFNCSLEKHIGKPLVVVSQKAPKSKEGWLRSRYGAAVAFPSSPFL